MARKGKAGSNSLLTTRNVMIAVVVAVVAFLAYDMTRTFAATPAKQTRARASSSDDDDEMIDRSDEERYVPPKVEYKKAAPLTPEQKKKKATTWLSIGMKYFSGKGRNAKNPQKAFDMVLLAAEADLYGAQFVIGTCYHYGYVVKRDSEKAKHWYTKAVENPDIEKELKETVQKVLDDGVKDPGTGDASIEEIENALPFDTGKGDIAERMRRDQPEEEADYDESSGEGDYDDIDDGDASGEGAN